MIRFCFVDAGADERKGLPADVESGAILAVRDGVSKSTMCQFNAKMHPQWEVSVLELWNSRSSWRSVWPKSPLGRVSWLFALCVMVFRNTSASTSTTKSYPRLAILSMSGCELLMCYRFI